jgi:hypothetical protein
VRDDKIRRHLLVNLHSKQKTYLNRKDTYHETSYPR